MDTLLPAAPEGWLHELASYGEGLRACGGGVVLPLGAVQPFSPNSVVSLSSCRLDEDGKVLTPEELLYRVSGRSSRGHEADVGPCMTRPRGQRGGCRAEAGHGRL